MASRGAFPAPSLVSLFVGSGTQRSVGSTGAAPDGGSPCDVAVAATSVDGAEIEYDLTGPTRCLAGGIGESSQHEWRVQLALFDDLVAARRFGERAEVQKIDPALFIAAWLARGDREPIVVVSRAYPSRADAARALPRYKRIAGSAFVRRYRVWN